MNKDRIRGHLVELGFEPGERLRRLEYHSNRDPQRQIYEIPAEVIVKAYGCEQFARFAAERTVARLAPDHGVPTPTLLAEFAHDDEAYLLFSWAPGQVLNDVYQRLSLDGYCHMLAALGRAVASCHGVVQPIPDLDPVPGCCPNHRHAAETRWRRADSILERCARSGILGKADRQNCERALEEVRERILETTSVLCHGDIHNENVFFDTATGEITLIDWETAAVQPRELDFVHPYLNIIGEAFPRRRLATEGASPLREAFEAGYGTAIDWPVVAAHGLLWYLEKSETTLDTQLEASRFFARTALGALEGL